MLITKCLSTIIASVIFIDSSFVGLHVQAKTPQAQPATPTYTTTEEVIVDKPITKVEQPIEVVTSKPVEPKPVKPVKKDPKVVTKHYGLTDSEIDLIALVTMAEAEGESKLGKRLVIDVILNRYESSRFPNTIKGVIYTKNQFECMWNGRIDRCHVRDDIRKLVIEELERRTNSNIHYFRTNHYHGFGKPVMSEGNHYFSTY